MEMDFTSLNLNNVVSSAKKNTAYDTALKKDYKNATEKELMDACKTFEAYFVEQVFKNMQKTVPESEYTSSASKTTREFFNEQLLSEYAKQAVDSGEGFGIAKALYEQMKNNYGLTSDPSDDKSTKNI